VRLSLVLDVAMWVVMLESFALMLSAASSRSRSVSNFWLASGMAFRQIKFFAPVVLRVIGATC